MLRLGHGGGCLRGSDRASHGDQVREGGAEREESEQEDGLHAPRNSIAHATPGMRGAARAPCAGRGMSRARSPHMALGHSRQAHAAASQSAPGAQSFLPPEHTLPALRAAVAACHGCPLYRHATQAVFGEGGTAARIMMIGEQPGDSEDLAGRPFVGPAGRVLDAGLATAGIPRDDVYVTNVVKHFKFTRRGKRRIHEKPTQYEVSACRPWLTSELELVAPAIVVVLGATAAQSLLGRAFRVTKERGVERATALAPHTFATVHPASVLRAPDEALREEARLAFFADLRLVGECYRRLGPVRPGAAAS
jgi:DNA polymerase